MKTGIRGESPKRTAPSVNETERIRAQLQRVVVAGQLTHEQVARFRKTKLKWRTLVSIVECLPRGPIERQDLVRALEQAARPSRS
jgi:hypothetical protein